MKKRNLSPDMRAAITVRVKLLLETSKHAKVRPSMWHGLEPSYAKAYGIMEALDTLNFGTLDDSGLDNNDPRNLSAWFEQLKREVWPEAM